MNQNELLDKVIEYLQSLRNNPEVNITIEPPHVEEIASSCSGQVYGKSRSSIEIEAKTLYTKDSFKIFDNWKEVK